jgi:hypothetical protein
MSNLLNANREVLTILASEARNFTTTSGIISNPNHRGLALYLDVTSVSTSQAQVATLNIKTPIPLGQTTSLATLYAITVSSDSSAASRAYLVYPNACSSASWAAVPVVGPLPSRFVVEAVHTTSKSMTYSVQGCLLI